MKDILKRFNAAPWPKKILFVLAIPLIVALGTVLGAFLIIHHTISSAYEILTGDEM